jgi:ferric-dicitrate binding protein FerR (iron transport regulator)
MSDARETRLEEPGDDLETLLGRVAARERPGEAAEAAAFAALHSEWRRHTATRRRHRSLALATAAAASLAVAGLGFFWLQSRTPSTAATLATIELVDGGNVTWRDDRSQVQPLGARSEFAEGERLATGPTTRVALRWHDGGSLRLDSSSRLELVSADAVRLTAGSLYFDSVGGTDDVTAPALAVQTPAGEVVHLGTQFMVTVASDEVVLSVREGQVKVTGDGFELVVETNEELDLRSDGTREITVIDGHGERWAWAADVAPQIELDGRATYDVVAWAARETGRRVVYATAAAQMRARNDALRGIDRRSPSGILTLLPHLTGLTYEILGDTIVVSEP